MLTKSIVAKSNQKEDEDEEAKFLRGATAHGYSIRYPKGFGPVQLQTHNDLEDHNYQPESNQNSYEHAFDRED